MLGGGIAMVVIVGVILYHSITHKTPPPDEMSTNVASITTFQEYLTPCEVTENRGFYLESDDSIAEKFPGISEVIIYPGKGKSRVPEGRYKGPIKFFDPSDSLNGHKSFRIYPVNN